MPKAANVSHQRVLSWCGWFAGMMGSTPADRLYNCLPMYHSVGGVVAIGGVLVNGGSVVLEGEVLGAGILVGRGVAGIAPCFNTSASFAVIS